MSSMELNLLDLRRKGHEAISAALSDFDRMGYLVSNICFKNGDLEVVCRPPDKEGGKEESAL
jgi:hypothetical protein